MPERKGKVSLTERILSSVQQFPMIYAAAETISTLTISSDIVYILGNRNIQKTSKKLWALPED